jgi:hypothetical protein
MDLSGNLHQAQTEEHTTSTPIHAASNPSLPGRTLTTPARQIRIILIIRHHATDTGVNPQDRRHRCTEPKNQIPRIPEQILFEAPHPALETLILPLHHPGQRIEFLIRQHRVTLGLEAEHQERWERIGELEDARRANESREDGDLRDGDGDDEGEEPVDGDEKDPEEFALSGFEDGPAEEFAADVVVEHFDADVAVEAGGDQARDEFERVGGRLPAVGVDALVGGVEGVLALVRVDY